MTEELKIVHPEEFNLKQNRFFCCPQCKSKAIALNPNFTKNNIANSLDDNLKNNENIDKIVLICANCEYVDLLISFLESQYERYGYSDLISPPNYTPSTIQPNKNWIYTSTSKTKNIPYKRVNSKNTWTAK